MAAGAQALGLPRRPAGRWSAHAHGAVGSARCHGRDGGLLFQLRAGHAHAGAYAPPETHSTAGILYFALHAHVHMHCFVLAMQALRCIHRFGVGAVYVQCMCSVCTRAARPGPSRSDHQGGDQATTGGPPAGGGGGAEPRVPAARSACPGSAPRRRHVPCRATARTPGGAWLGAPDRRGHGRAAAPQEWYAGAPGPLERRSQPALSTRGVSVDRP